MSWFNRKPKKHIKRSAIIKRRGTSAERLIFWAKRGGLTVGLFVFIGWLGLWFFMSGASTRLGDYAHNQMLNVTSNMGFEVANILVEGRQYTDVDTIKAIVNVNKGDPLFLFDPSEAQRMISKISWVKSVAIERRLPNTIYIGLTERQPMALWQRQKRLSLIDTEGVILTDHKLERFKNYIIVTGESVPSIAPSFLELLASEPSILSRIESASFISDRRWDVVLKSGIQVKLPEDEVALALRSLAVMHTEEGLMDKDIKVIDVREPSRITVRTKPGAVQEYKANYHNSLSGGAI